MQLTVFTFLKTVNTSALAAFRTYCCYGREMTRGVGIWDESSILCFATRDRPPRSVDSVAEHATGSHMLTALVVLLRSIGLMCRGHRAVALRTWRFVNSWSH